MRIQKEKNIKNLKKITIALITIILIQICLPIIGNIDIINVSNAETFENFEYTIIEETNSVEIKKYKGNATELTIPNTIDGKNVTSIGFSAFVGCSSLTKINIPEGVTSIKSAAFYGCSSLTEINIPDGVTSIGSSTFSKCSSLTEINIPDGVTSIGFSAFEGCISLTEIQIPAGVTSIGDWAFLGCSSLTEINIPAGVTSIGDLAFDGCSSLTKINIPEGVTSIGDWAFYRCSSLTEITIPGGVTSIGKNAFDGCSLYLVSDAKEIELPEIIQRAKIEGDILYSDSNFKLVNCNINSENTKLIINDNLNENQEATLRIQSGKMDGLTLKVTKHGTIIYNKSTRIWKKENILAKLIFADGDTITNNNGKNYYIFEQNGEFTFKYTTKSGENKTAKAQVDNIDKEKPIINSVSGNPTNWTNQDVTITIDAKDELSGLATEAYSFDGGKTWQESNSKTYTKNEKGIVIKIKDEAGNIVTGETINITKIDKENPIITSVTGNATNWTNQDVTITINAQDELSGLATKAYSFDGGKTWQESNSKTYTKNETGIVIKVKDALGNIATGATMNITKIDKDGPKVTITTKKMEQTNKIKVELTSNEPMKNINELNISNKENIESWNLSEDEKILILVYVNNTDEDIKITDIFNIKDELGNESQINLEKQDIVIKVKMLEIENNIYKVLKKNEKNYISNIGINTTLKDLTKNIQTNATMKIYKANTEITEKNTKISTGMKIVISTKKENQEYTIAVNGDTNGDGESNLKDILAINKHRLNKTILQNEYFLAGDINKDNTVDLKDILQINKFRLGKISNL